MGKVPPRWWLWPGGSTRYGPRYTYFVPASAFVCELRSFALLLVVTVLVPLLLYCTDGTSTSTSTSTSTQIASIDFLPLDRPGGPWAGSIFWALHQSNSLNLETKPRSRASIDHPGRGESCLLACCLLLGCTAYLHTYLVVPTAEVPTSVLLLY
ncbi:hypothetical protein HDV62DRAFT_342466 [Trichoderma sp. SZMC 28011]